MMKRASLIIITLSAMLVGALRSAAQTDAQFSQYYEVPTFYNPAAVGQTDFLRIRGGARMQWVGIEGAPQSFVITGDMPVKLLGKRIGVGALVNTESAGLFHSLNIGAQAGYKFRAFGGTFTVALQAGMYDQSFRGSEVVLPDGDDYHQGTDEGIPTQDIHGMALDLGLGVWYEHRLFYAGLSSTHLNSPTVSMNVESASGGSETSSDRKYQFRADRTLYFTGGSNIQIKNTLFEIAPSVLVKTDFTFWTGEITARLRYNKLFYLGLGYRWRDAVIITAGVDIKNFFLGYSYDYATSAIHKASSGSHEIVAGYKMKLDFSDKNKNRHKSIRLM